MPSNIAIDILPILLLFLCIFGAKITKPSSSINSKDYLSLATSKSYRGLFAIVVIFHHLAQRTETGFFFHLFTQIGQPAVAFFFFLSGYGLQKSYITKSDKYREGFLLKRIPTVLIPYIIITAIYWLMHFFLGHFYSLNEIIHSFIIGRPISENSWFIVNILIFYVVFWLLMRICKKHYFMMILGGFIWYILHFIFCLKMKYGSYWYLSSHLLIIGMLYATYEQSIINLFKKNTLQKVFFLACIFSFLYIFSLKTELLIGTQVFANIFSISSVLIYLIIFVISTLAFFLKIHLGNKVLNFLGEISLELYISHGLFVIVLRSKFIFINNELIWSISVLAGTILFSYGLHILFQAILNVYKRTVLKPKVIN